MTKVPNRGRGTLVSPDGAVASEDQPWSRVKADSKTIMRKLAIDGRKPNEIDPSQGRKPAPAKPRRGRVPGLTEAQAAAEYVKWSKTFEKLGLKPLFAPGAGVLAFVNRELTGKPLAKKLRDTAAGYVAHAQEIEDAAEKKQEKASTEDAADF